MISLRSSPTKLRLAFTDLMESCDEWRGQVQRAQADIVKLREELLEHRQSMTGILEETLEELGRVERRRKTVTQERQRAEKAREEPEEKPVQCPMCQYTHPGEDCMAHARRRWAGDR
ncbi:MAG TPA: hypothetical protein VJP77_09880 [Planctomycetota bacterium]|nr:hypothetical protein [Planctomycetota bacterium]